jgi:hypothetical protein
MHTTVVRSGHGISGQWISPAWVGVIKNLFSSKSLIYLIFKIIIRGTNAATAIPNATISWWYNKIEIGREDKDINFQIIGWSKV